MQPSPSTAACSPDCFRAVYPEAPLLGPPRTAVAAAAVAGAAAQQPPRRRKGNLKRRKLSAAHAVELPSDSDDHRCERSQSFDFHSIWSVTVQTAVRVADVQVDAVVLPGIGYSGM